MLSICFALSLALVYFIAASLVVTAFCMNLEPEGYLIFISREPPVLSEDDDNSNNVIITYDTDQDEE
jgi:hypothetical protein